jgi:putative ABC transport system substrate-binding protein
VPNLNRPAGNVTGVSTRAGVLPTKRLELLHELIPTATTIAMLINPDNANAQGDVADAQIAAQSVGLSLLVVRAAGRERRR